MNSGPPGSPVHEADDIPMCQRAPIVQLNINIYGLCIMRKRPPDANTQKKHHTQSTEVNICATEPISYDGTRERERKKRELWKQVTVILLGLVFFPVPLFI